jgi:hypothetical protein
MRFVRIYIPVDFELKYANTTLGELLDSAHPALQTLLYERIIGPGDTELLDDSSILADGDQIITHDAANA